MLSIPKNTYLDQAARAARADLEVVLRERVHASFEAISGVCGSESIAVRRFRSLSPA